MTCVTCTPQGMCPCHTHGYIKSQYGACQRDLPALEPTSGNSSETIICVLIAFTGKTFLSSYNSQALHTLLYFECSNKS